MTYKEIESYFVSAEKLEELLQKCNEEYFNKINIIAGAFINNVHTTPDDTNSALEELTGYYMNLIEIYRITETFVENKEAEYFINSDGTLSLTMVRKAAMASVSVYRRVCKIFEAYIDKCEKSILTCQSQLKYWLKDLELHK